MNRALRLGTLPSLRKGLVSAFHISPAARASPLCPALLPRSDATQHPAASRRLTTSAAAYGAADVVDDGPSDEPLETISMDDPRYAELFRGKEAKPRFTIMGNVGREMQVYQTKTGKTVGKFPVAVNGEDFEGQKKTMWVDIVMWNEVAEFWQGRLKKGMGVGIHGEPYISRWMGRAEDGSAVERERFEVTVPDAQYVAFLKRPNRSDDGYGNSFGDDY